MKKALAALALVTLLFLIPILSGVPLPQDLSSHELGVFIGSIIKYWLDVIKYALQKVGLNLHVASLSCKG